MFSTQRLISATKYKYISRVNLRNKLYEGVREQQSSARQEYSTFLDRRYWKLKILYMTTHNIMTHIHEQIFRKKENEKKRISHV